MNKEKSFWGGTSGRIIIAALAVISILGLFSTVSTKTNTAHAETGCMPLAEMPLEVRGQAAPPLVNISWDASGSMLFTFFTEDDRYDDYGYVFPERNRYYTNIWGNSLPESRRNEWRATYSGYNYMYYDPGTTYDPWPRWNELKTPAEADAHADIDNPRYHPMEPDYTFDLNAPFYIWNVDTEEGENPEDLGIVIDDEDLPVSDGTITVDDSDPGFSYTREGSWTNWPNSDFVNGQYQNIYLNQSVSATWEADVEHPGEYEVWVSISFNSNRTSAANYTVGHDNGADAMTVSQSNDSFQQDWISLGNYDFTDIATITMECGATNNYAAVDAVMLVPNFTVPGPSTSFSSTGPWQSANSNQAYPEDASNDNYLYTDSGGTQFTATWTVNNLDTSKTYDVYARWVAVSNRSTEVEYTIDHAGGSETLTVNQQSSGGQWNRLASDLSFGSSGSVTLDHTPAASSSDRASADAVLFIESGLYDPGIVIFAHYFTMNEEGDVFLVNLDEEISYYRADLDEDGIIVERLISMTVDEAEDEGIVTGRTYLEERQNFADWYQFYRRRYFTGIAAVGKLIDDWSNVFIRITSYPDEYYGHNNFFRGISPLDVTIRDASGTANHYDERDEVLSEWYRHDLNRPWGGTPLRRGLYQVGQFFETGSSDDWSGDSWNNLPADSPFREYSSQTYYPYFTPEHGGECQHSFAIVMTDGKWNGTLGYSVGNADAADTDFSGGVFADSESDTAADVAMHFYHRDLRSDMQNLVPTSDVDEATHQHMVTYGISFGIPGQHFTDDDRQEYGQYLRYGVEPDDWPGWPSISSGTNSTIDDLWHATVNGRGEFFSASNPDRLIEAMAAIKDDIEQRTGTAAAVSTSTVRQQVGTSIFQAQYNSSRWSGDLMAKTLEGVEIWSASDELDDVDYDERVIFTYNDQSQIGVPFRFDQLSPAQQALLNDDANLVNFLRGDRGQEIRNGGTFRNRASKLGDIVHSEPAHHNGVVYVGANDGMLHAFDSESGAELFAYVPNIVFENLEKLSAPEYIYQYFVNGPPFVRKVDEESILVGGLRRGGKGYYALNVTDAHSATESGAVDFVKWEFTPAEDIDDPSDLGYSYSTPFIMKTEAEEWVVVFGNGYNSENEEAVLYVLDIEDGSVIKKFHTGITGCNGIVGDLAPVDIELDGYIDFVYAGDLQGNLWKFDFRGEAVSDWEIAYSAEPLFTARNENEDVQPITSAPDVMFHCNHPGYMVIFGTGMFDNELDFGNTETQSIYGIWDWQEAWEYREENPSASDDKHLGFFTTDRKLSNLTNIADLPPDTRSRLTLLQQEVESEIDQNDETYHFITDNEITYWDPYSDEGDHLGWYLDLPQPGERVIIDPQIRAGHVWVMASIPSLSPCVSGGSAMLYALNACTGGEPSRPQFDVNDDGVVNVDDVIEPPDGGEERPPGAFSIPDLPPGFTILEPGLMIVPDPLGEDIRTWVLEAQRSRKTYWYEW